MRWSDSRQTERDRQFTSTSTSKWTSIAAESIVGGVLSDGRGDGGVAGLGGDEVERRGRARETTFSVNINLEDLKLKL